MMNIQSNEYIIAAELLRDLEVFIKELNVITKVLDFNIHTDEVNTSYGKYGRGEIIYLLNSHLKDKYGKYIVVGDILSYKGNKYILQFGVNIGFFIENIETFEFDHIPVGFNIEFLSDFVVIGNIYRDRVKKEKNNG